MPEDPRKHMGLDSFSLGTTTVLVIQLLTGNTVLRKNKKSCFFKGSMDFIGGFHAIRVYYKWEKQEYDMYESVFSLSLVLQNSSESDIFCLMCNMFS